MQEAKFAGRIKLSVGEECFACVAFPGSFIGRYGVQFVRLCLKASCAKSGDSARHALLALTSRTRCPGFTPSTDRLVLIGFHHEDTKSTRNDGLA